jgi:hypothetical protein
MAFKIKRLEKHKLFLKNDNKKHRRLRSEKIVEK